MSTKPVSKAAPKGPTTLDQMTDLVRVMYYGDPGKGKTTAMAHMAKLGKVIYIDAEKRLKPGPLRRMGIPLENIEVHSNVSYAEMTDLVASIQERLHDGEDIFGVCWDSATETGRILLEDLVNSAVAKSDRAGKERDPWKTFQEDYGDLTEQMRRLIRRLRDLDVHLAISCLSKRDTDEDGAVRVAPALTPAVLRDFLGYMDVVAHVRLEIVNGEEEYSALTKPIGRFEAKDSFGVLPRTLVNPSFDRIFGYVNGTISRDKDPLQLAAKAARQKQDDTKTASAPAE